MVLQDSTALRHTPKQSRGQRKVEHILRSAEALFAEIGFENATTNAIAVRANISIGSLYQFFSSKEAILETMASRYLRQTQDALVPFLTQTSEVELDVMLTQILEALVAVQERRPYFLQCLGQAQPSPVLIPAVEGLSESAAEKVAQVLGHATTEENKDVLLLRARICVKIMSALLPVVLRARGRERSRAMEEVKLVLIRYLEPTLKVKGML